MKRLLLIAMPVALVIGGYFFITWDPTAPKFERLRSFKIPAYTSLHYAFLASQPFAGGKMWITLRNTTNWSSSYLYDIEQQKVTGELHDANPVFLNGDQSRLLCVRRGPGKVSFFQKGRLLAEKVVSPRFLPWKRKAQIGDDIETFWLLELSSNWATPIGTLSQFRGGGSTFRPSPDFRFAFNMSVASRDALLVCDLEKKSWKVLKVRKDGWPVGWWDNQNILYLNQTNDFLLLNAVSESLSPLLPATNVLAFLDKHGIDHQGQRPTAFFSWNGREYDFYVTDTHRKWSATNSFLLKIERPDARLALVSPQFKFEWSDHFDETQRYYVFTGREMGKRSDGVFLRDLKTKTERTLVEPEDANYMSIPSFYGTNVIYIRSNQLWRIDFNGSNNVRLFPPPER